MAKGNEDIRTLLYLNSGQSKAALRTTYLFPFYGNMGSDGAATINFHKNEGLIFIEPFFHCKVRRRGLVSLHSKDHTRYQPPSKLLLAPHSPCSCDGVLREIFYLVR